MTRDGTTDRMQDISCTNPYASETFTTACEHDPAATDGGRSDATPASMDATGTKTMGDVGHISRNDEGASQAQEHGHDDRVVPGDGYE